MSRVAPLVAGWWKTLANPPGPMLGGGSLPSVALPIALVVELLVAGAWVDVTPYVLQGTQVVITRGRPNEAAKTAPGSCTLAFDDGPTGANGALSPRNPAGPYFGQIGRNTPLRVSAAGRVRFVGEVSSWAPEWEHTHRVRAVKVEATGVLRRLAQGQPAGQSAPRRYIPTTAPVAYWPLTDGPLSTAGEPVVGRYTADYTSYFAPEAVWGKGDLAPWLEKSVATRGVDGLDMFVDMPAFTDRWAVDHVRAGGLGADSSLLVLGGGTTGGTITQQWTLDFLPATKTVRLQPPSGGSSSVVVQSLFDRGGHHVRLATTQVGGSVDWSVAVDGAAMLSGSWAGTLAKMTALSYQDLLDHPGEPLALGHLAAWTAAPPLAAAAAASLGYPGETTGNRLARLCAEEGLPFTYDGAMDATKPVGRQGPSPLLALLEECAATDQGTLLESRTVAGGLHYRAARAFYNQVPRLVLLYQGGQVAPPLEPVDDDQATRNLVVAKGRYGGEYTAALATGPLSVLPPPLGVGTYDTSVDVNSVTAAQLADVAWWLVHLGTVDEPRYPRITVDLAAPDVGPTLSAAVLDADVDDLVVLVGAGAVYAFDDVRQVARGTVEVIDTAYRYTVGFNCAPASAYDVFRIEHDVLGRLHTAGSALAADATAGATSLSVATTVEPIWGTQVPYDVVVDGERMTVTAVAGASSPQTFTVVRAVNGVARAHPAGASVRLHSRHVVAL